MVKYPFLAASTVAVRGESLGTGSSLLFPYPSRLLILIPGIPVLGQGCCGQ